MGRFRIATFAALTLFCSVVSFAGDVKPRPNYMLSASYESVTNTDNLRDLFLAKNGHMGYSIQLGFDTKPGGKHDACNEILNYPVFGIGLNYDNYRTMGFTNNSRLGNFVDLYGFMEASLYKSRVVSAGFLLDFGLGVTNVVYDPKGNPFLYNIGAPMTVFMAFGPQVKVRFTENMEAVFNAYWLHHSNGNAWMPNFGLNDLALGLGLRYNPGGAYTEQVRKLRVPHDFERKLSWDVYATTGFHACKTEFTAFNRMVDDPEEKKDDFVSHPRAGVGVDAQYRYGQMCSSGMVADVVYNWGIDELRKSDLVIYGKEEVANKPAEYSPVNVSLGVIHEFHYGNFSALCAVCGYLFRKVGINEDTTRFFQRAGFRYYFPRLSNSFLGCCIRATKFNNADYFEFQLGVKI